MLGVSIRTVERHCADGGFQPVRIGKCRRIPARQVYELLGAKAEPSDPEADGIAASMLKGVR